MTALLVLYEDSRGANGKFGPHVFFLGCVADITGIPIDNLKQVIRDCPVNGASKLLSHLRDTDDLDLIAPNGEPILAILDDDHVRDHHPASKGMNASKAAAKIKADSSAPHRVTVVLLERNLESVVKAFQQCGESATDLIAEALEKRLNARDRLFDSVGRDPSKRQVRDCVRKTMPCVEHIVQAMRAAVA